MKRRGQVTVFIIIGLIILLFTGAIYLILNNYVKQDLSVEVDQSIETSPFKLFIETCLEDSFTEALYLVLSQGGYYNFPEEVLVFDFSENFEEEQYFLKPYYLYDSNLYQTSLSDVELEVALATEDYFTNCIDNFSVFTQNGYEISLGEKKVVIDFNEYNTNVELDFPIEASIRNEVVLLEKFSLTLPFNFFSIYNEVENLLSEQKNSDTFLVGLFSSMAYTENHDFNFDQYDYQGSNVLINLEYPTGLDEEMLVYSFILNFDWSNLDSSVEQEITEQISKQETINDDTFILKSIPELNITEPGTFSYQIEATDKGIKYYLDTKDINIDQDSGLISFSTSDLINDEYLFYVRIINQKNITLTAPLILNVNVNDGNLPVIEKINGLQAIVGEEFNYQVKIQDFIYLNYEFSSDSPLFEIDEFTGEISFTPQEEDIGLYNIRVDAENQYGNTWERWLLEIK